MIYTSKTKDNRIGRAGDIKFTAALQKLVESIQNMPAPQVTVEASCGEVGQPVVEVKPDITVNVPESRNVSWVFEIRRGDDGRINSIRALQEK